jgi:hypothetical protein
MRSRSHSSGESSSYERLSDAESLGTGSGACRRRILRAESANCLNRSPEFEAPCDFYSVELPPALPSKPAIQRRVPNKPWSSDGRYRSASSFGQWSPRPVGVISMAAKSEDLAPARPCASPTGTPRSSPLLSVTTMRAPCRSYRVETARGCACMRACMRFSAFCTSALVSVMNLHPLIAQK